MNPVTVIKIGTDNVVSLKKLERSESLPLYKSLAREIGNECELVECVPVFVGEGFPRKVDIVVDESGLLRDKRVINPIVTHAYKYSYAVGDAICIGVINTADGPDWGSLTPDQILALRVWIDKTAKAVGVSVTWEGFDE